MKQEDFDQIKSELLKKHYEDRMHYSSQPGNVSGDIKNGIHMVIDALENLSLTGTDQEVLSAAAEKISNLYSEYSSLPAVMSDKQDKFGFTCAVLKRCAEDLKKFASKSK